MTVALGTNIANPISTALSQWLGFDTMGKLENYGKLGAAADPDAVITALFASGEQGLWYDYSDLTTMFQDRAGTTPVTADGQTVGKILDKSGRGNHATAPNDSARPLYKTDGTYHWLQFDGVDDSLVSPAIDFTATDKMGLWLGVKKNNSTGSYAISLTQSPPAFDGSFAHYFNNATSDQVYLRGQATAVYRTTEQSGVPNTRVLTDLFNLQTAVQQDQLVTRENGVVIPGLITASTTVPATFANDQLFIASRGGVAAFAACHIYSIIVRGALSTTQEITDTETWVNGKTGSY